MKVSLKISIAFVITLGAMAGGAVSVSGQEPILITKCLSDTREIRVPKAEVTTDESGESAYKIDANQTWRRTDIEVKRGQKIEITATGIIRWAQDGSAWTFVTPDGTRPPHANHFPHPDAGIGSLIMRIGKGIYAAGSNITIESQDEGPIELMSNDDILTDNSGHFLVKLSIQQY